MIINHTHGFVFVHVPKAAGTSISRLFTPLTTYRDQEIGGTPMGEITQPFFKRRWGLAKHSTAPEVRFVMGAQRFDKFFSFAFVRNPYTRAYSTFNYFHRQQDHKELATLLPVRDLATFGEFVRSEYFQGDGMDRILQPQTFWTDVAPGVELSFIGSVEAIDADLAYIVRRVAKPGKKVKKQVQERNRSTQDPDKLWRLLREDPEAERLVFERYRSDFERYGYERLDMARTTDYDERRIQDRAAQPHASQLLAQLESQPNDPTRAKQPQMGGGAGKKKKAALAAQAGPRAMP